MRILTKTLITLILFLLPLAALAQTTTTQDQKQEQYNATMREKIGLDYSMPDYTTTIIDANVMGTRLAGILSFLMENFYQPTYNRMLGQIVGEQNESLQHIFFEIVKLNFVKASKEG